MIHTLIAGLVLAGGPHHIDDWMEYWGETPLAPRLPVLASGDPTYSGGNPVYDSGSDLGTVTTTANFYGTYAKEVAAFILAQDGVRMDLTFDSQGSGGDSRAYTAILSTWPVEWSTLWAPPSGSDPFYFNRSNPNAYMISGQWNDEDTTVSGSSAASDVADILSIEGIGDPSEIPVPWSWFDDVDTAAGLGGPNRSDDAHLDKTRFDSEDGTLLRFKLLYLSGGNTAAPTEISLRTEYYNSGGSIETPTDDIADTTAVSGLSKTVLGASNNNAVLSYHTTTPVISYPSSSSSRPRAIIREDTEDFDNLSIFALGGQCQRMVDASTPEDLISISRVRYASGMNPGMWIAGAQLSGSGQLTHGANATIRQWLLLAVGNPNVLFYSYGHNSITRTGSGFKAESTFQADLFDLIYQDASDYYTNNGSWPYVVVNAPWYAGNMNDTRHAQIMGVVQALEEVGIKVLGTSSYNFWGGDSFTAATPSESTDYENSTTFELDFDGDPEGSGVHPNSADDANIAWYGVYRILEEAANSSTNRSRDRSRNR